MDPIKVTGRAYPAGTSKQVPATMEVAGNSVVITSHDGHELGRSDLKHLEVDHQVGTAPRKLKLLDGTLFETQDFDAVERIKTDPKARLLHSMEAFRGRLVVVVAACIAGGVMVYTFALPLLVTVAVWLTPPALERTIDRGTMQTIDLTMAEPTSLDPEKMAEAEELFARLLNAMPPDQRTASNFNLQFRDLPGMGPNAFALPGGTIVLTDALVTEFDDPDIIGGILGHEIGHVVDKHGLRQLYRSLGIYVLIALIVGDTGPILEDIILEGNVLLSLANSRAHERDADDFGIRLADAAGLDPAGLLEFFEALPSDGTPSWYSSHPAHEERQENIRSYIDGN